MVQYAVLVAYHLILETAFLLDQKAMFSTLPLDRLENMSLTTDQQPYTFPSEANASWPEDPIVESDSSGATDIFIANGFYKEGARDVGLDSGSLLPCEPYNPLLFKNNSNKTFYAEGILVLMSRWNSSTGSICEQSHFSHIKFYRNFDVPLGIFLKDNLLNQVRTNYFCDLNLFP